MDGHVMRERSRVDASMVLMDSTRVPIGLIGDAISATTICVVCALLQEEDKFSWSVYVYVFVLVSYFSLNIHGIANDKTSPRGGIRIGSVLYCA